MIQELEDQLIGSFSCVVAFWSIGEATPVIVKRHHSIACICQRCQVVFPNIGRRPEPMDQNHNRPGLGSCHAVVHDAFAQLSKILCLPLRDQLIACFSCQLRFVGADEPEACSDQRQEQRKDKKRIFHALGSCHVGPSLVGLLPWNKSCRRRCPIWTLAFG